MPKPTITPCIFIFIGLMCLSYFFWSKFVKAPGGLMTRSAILAKINKAVFYILVNVRFCVEENDLLFSPTGAVSEGGREGGFPLSQVGG